MDFLDLCERVAALAQQEADLRERQRQARARAAAAECAGIADEIEVIRIEKRLMLLRALDDAG